MKNEDQIINRRSCDFILEERGAEIMAISLAYNSKFRIEIGQTVIVDNNQYIVSPGAKGKVIKFLEPYSSDQFGHFRTTDIIYVSFSSKHVEDYQYRVLMKFEHLNF